MGSSGIEKRQGGTRGSIESRLRKRSRYSMTLLLRPSPTPTTPPEKYGLLFLAILLMINFLSYRTSNVTA